MLVLFLTLLISLTARWLLDRIVAFVGVGGEWVLEDTSSFLF